MGSKARALARLESNPRMMAALMDAVRSLGLDLKSWPTTEELVRIVQTEGRRRWPKWAGKVDGWPGNNFGDVLWHLARTSESECLELITAVANGEPTRYKMDMQNSRWFEHEWDRDGDGSDCSDLIAYGIGRRKAGGPGWLNSKGQQNWTHTGSIYHDAMRAQRLFRRLELDDGLPGLCIFSYADANGGQGHTGFVWQEPDGNLMGIDCSFGRHKHDGDAVQIRSMEWTRRKIATRGLIYCKPVWWS